MSFQGSLRRVANGRVLEDCENALAEVIGAVKQTRGKGKVTLEFSVEFNETDGETFSVNVAGKVKKSIPLVQRPALTQYVREDLTLSSRDPRQPELPDMVDMAKAAGDLADIAGAHSA